MRCPRCQGLLVLTHLIDYQSTNTLAAKCVNCGMVSDPTIRRNASLPDPTVVLSANGVTPYRHTKGRIHRRSTREIVEG